MKFIPIAGADSIPFVVGSYADARWLWQLQRSADRQALRRARPAGSLCRAVWLHQLRSSKNSMKWAGYLAFALALYSSHNAPFHDYLETMTASILSSGRRYGVFGMAGGNRVERYGGDVERFDPIGSAVMAPGGVFVIATPGGGGCGPA